jgi:acyl-CoA reductase-like NAD-dependent aldehyde dehydrogenase
LKLGFSSMGSFVHQHLAKRDTVNPATGKTLASIAQGEAEDIEAAVQAARRAYDSKTWRGMPPRARKKVLLRLAELIERDLTGFALLESLDTGKPVADAIAVDIPEAIETLRWHAEAIDKIYDQVSPTPGDVVSMIVREPIGVVGTVIPWNFPLLILATKLGPALAGGNSIVVKPAEQTPLTALKLASLAAEAGIDLESAVSKHAFPIAWAYVIPIKSLYSMMLARANVIRSSLDSRSPRRRQYWYWSILHASAS